MSNGLNRVFLLGNLGADPELKYSASGTAILRLRIAVNERRKVGELGKRAEALAKFLSKGSTVFVEGRLETRSWEKDGKKQYETGVVANEVILAGGRAVDAGRSARGEAPKTDDDSFDFGANSNDDVAF